MILTNDRPDWIQHHYLAYNGNPIEFNFPLIDKQMLFENPLRNVFPLNWIVKLTELCFNRVI